MPPTPKPADLLTTRVIRATFDAYHQPGYADPDNEEHVARAVVRYVLSRYGREWVGFSIIPWNRELSVSALRNVLGLAEPGERL